MTHAKYETARLFPTVVHVAQVPDPAAFNAPLLEAVQRIRRDTPNGRPASWSGTVYTTLGSNSALHGDPAFAGFVALVQEQAALFARTLSLDMKAKPLALTECWVNVYGRGDSQEVHVHPNCIVSGNYFLKAPPGAAGLTFYSPMADVMLQPPTTGTTDDNTSLVTIEAKQGRLILFPSWLRHAVRASEIDDERITISINLRI